MEVFLLSFAQARKKTRLRSEDIYVEVNGDLGQGLLQFLTFGCFWNIYCLEHWSELMNVFWTFSFSFFISGKF